MISEISVLNRDRNLICLTLFPAPSDPVFILNFAILFIMDYCAFKKKTAFTFFNLNH